MPELFFSPREQVHLKEKLLDLLENKGVRLNHPVILDALAGAGALVDRDTSVVRLPSHVTEKLITAAPKTFSLRATDPEHTLNIPHPNNSFYARTGTGSTSYIDPVSGAYRQIRLEDLAPWARLVGELDHLDFCAFPTPLDIPEKHADIYALQEFLNYSPKHIFVQPYSSSSIYYLIKMAEIAAEETGEFNKVPPVSLITCALSPLDFKFMDLEVIVQACQKKIPLHACSLPGAGGTAPLTMPGTILLAVAETLTLLVSAQALNPGTPVIATPLIFSMDMQSGYSRQASVETIKGAAAAANFIKETFNLPVHTYGFGTDSTETDGQAQGERSMLALMAAAAGSDILGGAGQVETASTQCPLQLIIDNDLAAMVKKLSAGLSVDEDNLAWDELLQVEPGGHFLDKEHTFRHCRSLLSPLTFTHRSRKALLQDRKGNYLTKAKEAYEKITSKELKPVLSKEKSRDINSLVKEAERCI